MRLDLPALARRLTGVALLAPLAAGALWGLSADVACDVDCGEVRRGVFVWMLLTTPPAAAGVWLLIRDLPRRAALGRLLGLLAFAAVALCTLVLVGAAVAAGVDAIGKLTGEPRIVYVNDPGAGEAQMRREGWLMLLVTAFLAAMAAGAVAALHSAWLRLRARSSG